LYSLTATGCKLLFQLFQYAFGRQERVEVLTSELKDTKNALNTTRNELKASKARIQTLENQIRTLKSGNEALELKLKEKEDQFCLTSNDLKLCKEELAVVKEREKKLREKYTGELNEAQRSLTRVMIFITLMFIGCSFFTQRD